MRCCDRARGWGLLGAGGRPLLVNQYTCNRGTTHLDPPHIHIQPLEQDAATKRAVRRGPAGHAPVLLLARRYVHTYI